MYNFIGFVITAVFFIITFIILIILKIKDYREVVMVPTFVLILLSCLGFNFGSIAFTSVYINEEIYQIEYDLVVEKKYNEFYVWIKKNEEYEKLYLDKNLIIKDSDNNKSYVVIERNILQDKAKTTVYLA